MRAIFDGHNDALTAGGFPDLAVERGTGHLDVPRMVRGGLRGGVFAIFSPSAGGFDTEPVVEADGSLSWAEAPPLPQLEAAEHATAAAQRLFALERGGHLRIARSIGDLDDPTGPPVAVLGLEGAEAIDPALEALGTWFTAGLRVLGPVWSRANAFASGVPFRFPSSPDTGPGLTDAGVALVRGCADLGILVDLSHMNERGFWDVAALAPGPLVASHSGVHALSPCSRNLTDRQLDAVAGSDGLVGIVFATPFLRADFEDTPDTPLELVVEHARYVRDRVGIAHVALGSDFDGATVPAGIGDAAGLPALVDALRAGGFSEEELDALCWGNWRRVLGAWWR